MPVPMHFLIQLLRNHTLTNSGSQNANWKVRRLMSKLLSTTTVIPNSLFITDVKAEPHLGSIGVGGSGSVFRGEYKGQQVALKKLYKVHHYDVRAITRFFVLTILIGLERIQF
jgi:hypothetical protein